MNERRLLPPDQRVLKIEVQFDGTLILLAGFHERDGHVLWNGEASIVTYSTDAEYQIGHPIAKGIRDPDKQDIYNRLCEKYGAEEGYRRFMAGEGPP